MTLDPASFPYRLLGELDDFQLKQLKFSLILWGLDQIVAQPDVAHQPHILHLARVIAHINALFRERHGLALDHLV